MRIRVIAVGKLKEAHYRAAVDDYLARLERYAKVDEIEIREEALSAVAAAMRKALPPRAHVIALTIEGRARSSEELATQLEALSHRAVDVAFLIGGADGIPKELVALSNEQLSLSRMTLPHRLARLVLVEQLYRAMTIRRGEPYHH